MYVPDKKNIINIARYIMLGLGAFWISLSIVEVNKGFKKATGEIVSWLNSDDLYFPNAVSTAVHRFQEQPDLVIFYGDCVFID